MLTAYMQAFVSYLRSVYLHKDKSIFKVDELPVKQFAESLGLPGVPKIKFLSKELAKKKKNASREVAETLPPARPEPEEASFEAYESSEGESDEEDEDSSAEAGTSQEKVSLQTTIKISTLHNNPVARPRAHKI